MEMRIVVTAYNEVQLRTPSRPQSQSEIGKRVSKVGGGGSDAMLIRV